MATDHHSHGNGMENIEVSYEKRDLGARNILLFFAILFVVGVIVHFVILGVYTFMLPSMSLVLLPPSSWKVLWSTTARPWASSIERAWKGQPFGAAQWAA